MTTPDDIFWHASEMGLPSSLERVEQLRQAAATWTAQGQVFAAGMALSAVTKAGWGLLDIPRPPVVDLFKCLGL